MITESTDIIKLSIFVNTEEYSIKYNSKYLHHLSSNVQLAVVLTCYCHDCIKESDTFPAILIILNPK